MAAFCKRFIQSLFTRNSHIYRCFFDFREHNGRIAMGQRGSDDEMAKLCA